MDAQEYKNLKRIFCKILIGLGAKDIFIEDFAQDCIIELNRKPLTSTGKNRNKRKLAIDILRSYTGKKTSKSYETRKAIDAPKPLERISEKRYEIEFRNLPSNFIPRDKGSWPGLFHRTIKRLAKGQNQPEIAKKLGVTQSRISQLLKQHRPLLIKRMEWCNRPVRRKHIAYLHKTSNLKQIQSIENRERYKRYKAMGHRIVSNEYRREKRRSEHRKAYQRAYMKKWVAAHPEYRKRHIEDMRKKRQDPKYRARQKELRLIRLKKKQEQKNESV